MDKAEALKWAAESYNMLLEYAVQAKISVCIENHGGVSNDADWMVALMKEVNHLYFGSYPDWREPTEEFDNVEYLESELRLISEEYQYGGTADCIAKVDGETVLIDFKTSNGVYAEHLIQLAAYKNVIEEQTDYKIDRCMIIRVAKGEIDDNEERIQPHFIPNDIIDMGWETFKIARDLHEKNKLFSKFTRAENK